MSDQMCPKDHEHKHGETRTCYWYGCRCELCREVSREIQFYYRNMRRLGKYRGHVVVDAVGTHRRVQALATLGWSAAVVADRVGVSGQRMRQILSADRVLRETAARVAVVYDELWATPNPGRYGVTRTKNRAARLGWVPPLAWDDDSIDDPDASPAGASDPVEVVDEVAVQEALAGRPVRLSALERREAVRVAHEWRWSTDRITARLGVAERTVTRIRGELGLVAWEQCEVVRRDVA